MKNRIQIPLLAALTLLGVKIQAQQFFFSPERPGSCLAADGIITIVPTRGVPPFTYQWNTGATDLSLKNVPKGTYTATLTDATGATVSHTHILNSEEFDLYLSGSLPSSFCNPNSGALSLQESGGVAPFSYNWSDGQTGANAVGLTTGTYSVTAQDAAGCVAKGEYTVGTPPGAYYPTAFIVTVDEPDCANPAIGELQAGIGNSGYQPYTFAWSTGATTETITNLPAGTYAVTVTDALGCSNATSVAIQKKLTLTGSVICSGTSTGTAGALLANATAPVSYVWSNNQSGPSLSNLVNGYYGVTATDANGCKASGTLNVAIPQLNLYDYSSKCYTGNNAVASCWVNYDNATSFMWDNGNTNSWNNTLNQGTHTVTVTTTLGCTLVGSMFIAPPAAPPITIAYTAAPSNCSNGLGGALNVSISGGFPPYNFYAYGPDGFISTSIASLQNIQGGSYGLSAYSVSPNNCSAYVNADVPDAGGFNPELQVQELDCVSGYGSAAILNVSTPGAQYSWNMGASTSAVFNLTPGCYSATVTASSSCIQYYEFCIFKNDTIQPANDCLGQVSGALYNDLGIAGCNGATGIPFQMIQTMPSGALNFTDENGVYQVQLPTGAFDIEPVSYDPADIACPPGGFYTINAVAGTTLLGQDFHFYNPNALDHRVRQQALRTAQPGYPFSLRYEVCNDGNAVNAGIMDLEYGNFFGGISAASFAQHPGAFVLNAETSGFPNNTANYSFPGIAPGGCELLQVDFLTPVATPVNTEFMTRATVSPSSGDPTPDNNKSTFINTVVGSFDPNSVFAFPARNGNPHDGGELLRNVDQTITYQIFFQNTGNAPANQVIVKDALDPDVDMASIRNIHASHGMKVSMEDNNKTLVFKFPNINLPDSTSDYANSIGSIQYDIDLKPGLAVGTEIAKQAAIYFDFNPPILTNNNVLKIAVNKPAYPPAGSDHTILTLPSPADYYFAFYFDTAAEMRVFNTLGELVAERKTEAGWQQVPTSDFPSGMYLLRLEAGGEIWSGKVVVSH